MTSTAQGNPLVDTGAPVAVARSGFLHELRTTALVTLVALPSALLVALAGCAAAPATDDAHTQAQVQAAAERAGTAGACAPAAAAWCEAPTKKERVHVVFTPGTGGTFPE